MRRQNREGLSYRIPELGRKNRVCVCEGDGVGLAAGDEDFAVGEDDAVGEGAGVVHGC